MHPGDISRVHIIFSHYINGKPFLAIAQKTVDSFHISGRVNYSDYRKLPIENSSQPLPVH